MKTGTATTARYTSTALSTMGEDEEPGLENILEDEEFERVSEAFNDWMEEQDFGDIDPG